MKSTVFFKTDSTIYMYDNRLQNYTIAHPLIFHFYIMDQQGQLPSDFSLMGENDIFEKLSKKDVMYYFDKWLSE